MVATIAFDTHRFVKNLTAHGFTETQAEALADEQAHLLNANLATKTDIETIKADLQVEIEKVRAAIQTVKADLQVEIEKVRAEIQTVKADLLKWMVTAMIAQTGLIVALVRLL